MAWKAYNALLDDPGLLVFDSRSVRAYLDRHIRGSFCVKAASNRSTVECVAGPGPPAWSQDCWWGRHVLVVSPKYTRESEMRRALKLATGDVDSSSSSRKRPRHGHTHNRSHENVDPVIEFLVSEGRMKSLKLLETENDEDKDSYSAFAKRYPFLVTRSQKATVISGYPAEIVPELLYLGDLEHATTRKNLEELHITHILTIHTEPLKHVKGLVHLFFELADENKADIAQYFQKAFEFIESVRRLRTRVLVHCGAGASRSATLCAAYLMRINQWKADDALMFLKQQRRQVDPNPGFVDSLYQYERNLGREPQADARTSGPVGENSAVEEVTRPPVFDVLKEGTLLGTLGFREADVLVCGRGPTCGLLLDHASISRQHARLEYAGKTGLLISDLGSAHGTFVNSLRLPPGIKQKLHVGDVVTFGASTRRYVLRYAEEA